MENIINMLHDIEEKANLIIKRANDEKIKLHDALIQDLEKLEQDINSENVAKLNILKAQVDKEEAEEKQALINDCNRQLAELESNYNKNHEVLVSNIVKKIIST